MNTIIKPFTISVCLLLFFTTITHAQLKTTSNTVTTNIGTPPSTTAPNVEDTNLRQALIDTFGITMNGFDTTHLRWTWEKLHETNNTTFPSLLRGSIIQAQPSGISSQVGCFGGEVSLYLGQYQGEAFFKFILIHELAHIAQKCPLREQNRVVEHANALAREGYIAYYPANTVLCVGGDNGVNEDYADTLAYYFNPNAGFSSGPLSCTGPAGQNAPPNPYLGGKFPLHKAVAESL